MVFVLQSSLVKYSISYHVRMKKGIPVNFANRSVVLAKGPQNTLILLAPHVSALYLVHICASVEYIHARDARSLWPVRPAIKFATAELVFYLLLAAFNWTHIPSTMRPLHKDRTNSPEDSWTLLNKESKG
jgi:hypothetical protein